MILEKDFKESDIEIVGDQEESIEMSVDTESVNHLMMILSSNLYQDPIGSIIREYTSNAIDANVDAGCDEPVLVRLKMVGTNWIFEVQDFGPGLDDKDFRNIISKYGKSTKRDKADQLGYFGLGCKSGFAYTNQFNYTCIKDGMERKYLLYKGESGFTIDLLHEKKSDEKTGVTVTIPLKYYDNNNFYQGIKSQLAYFDNVYFDIDYANLGWAHKDDNLNKMRIFREEDFQWSNIAGRTEMHITLGRVCYPINWNTLGISSLGIPIALRFGLDSGLFPIPNRENLIWNDRTKELVKKRIADVADWFVNKYNATVQHMPNMVVAWDHINTSKKWVTLEGTQLDITRLAAHSPTQIKEVTVDGIKLREPSFYKSRYDALVKDFRIVGEKAYGSLRTKGATSWMSQLLNDKSKTLLLGEDAIIKGYFRDYLKSLDYNLFVKKKTDAELKAEDLEYYKQQLYLNSLPKAKWRDYIKEFQDVREACFKALWDDGTSFHSDKAFEDFKKVNKKKPPKKGSTSLGKQSHHVTIAYFEYVRWWAFKKKVYELEKLKKNKFLTVIMDETEAANAYEYRSMFSKQKVQFAQIGVKDMKRIEKDKPHNFMTLKEIQNTKVFSRVATGMLARKMVLEFERMNNSKIPIIKHCATKYYDLYKKVKDYSDLNYETYTNSDLQNSILQTAEDHNLWDTDCIKDVKELQQSIKDYEFLQYIRNDAKPEDLENVVNTFILFKKSRFADKFPDLQICTKEEV